MSASPDESWRDDAKEYLRGALVEKKIADNNKQRSDALRATAREHLDSHDRLVRKAYDLFEAHGEIPDE
jgi:hypothetical protein